MRYHQAFALGVLFAVVQATGQESAPEPYTITIYWTDTAPVLDGIMDEACWQDAAVITDFRTFQKPAEAATQQTTVRLCYDAEALYAFWQLAESRMDKLAYGPPEDLRDKLDFSGDVAELFLDPGKTRKQLLQFCASPQGTRFDSSSRRGALFNPEWRVRPAIGADGWTLELAIPFAELVQRGEFLGTPQVGDEWGLQCCRDQARLHEWSQWKPTPMSFHEVEQFGTLVFGGHKAGGPALTLSRLPGELLGFGPGAIEFNHGPWPRPTEIEYALLHDGSVKEQQRVAAAEGPVRLPFHLTEGGTWALRVALRDQGRPRFTGYTWTRLPGLLEALADIERNVRRAREALRDFRHPAAAELRTAVERLDAAATAPLQTARRAAELSRPEWLALETAVADLDRLWHELRFDLHLVQLYPNGNEVAAFAVGCAGPEEKIQRDTLFAGDLAGPVSVALAGRETESCQLALIPFWQDLVDVSIGFADLAGAGGAIPAASLSYRLVDYVRLEDIDPEDAEMREREPDILWPGKTFGVPRGQVRSVWIEVTLPAGTPAGDYAGRITISANGQTIQKALTVRAYGFDLPPTASLPNNFWFAPADFEWGRFYGSGHYGPIEYTPALYEQHARTLSRYRVTCFADSVLTLSPSFAIYREPDGHFSFDFSTWEQFIAIGLKYGSNAYRASLSCNLGAMYLFRDDRLIVDRASGRQLPVKEAIAEWTAAFARGEAYWDTHPIYRDYLKAYIAFMRRVGVLDLATWEIYDEPNSNPRWLDMLRHHAFLRAYVPELKLMNFGVDPTIRRADRSALGLIDVWAPHLPDITPEALRIMHERRAEFGEGFWFYTCGERTDKDSNVSPYLYYHRSYLGPRLHAWYAWDLQADGMLIFASSAVPEPNIKPKNREQQWPASEWLDGKYRGCGTLIYPGPNYELIPGMRLASIRDGLEDYDYFRLLHRLLAYADPETDRDLAEAIRRELRIEREILDGFFVWTKDRRLLEAKRDRLAALIQQAQAMIAKR